jgi:uncharacterized protein YndB with AHSA1/START domain
MVPPDHLPHPESTMRTVHASVEVAAPPSAAWALYADTARTPSWVPFVEEVLETSGPLEVGMTYRERTRLLGATAVNTWRVVELEPERRRVEVSRDLGIDSRLAITFEPTGRGTRIRQATELRSRLPRPFAWAHELVAAAGARHGLRGAVAGAARALDPGTDDTAGDRRRRGRR